ncbi:MAG TPA: nuclear transport factor 2 family protein [Acidimicrobiales bacterium]|nr:nuclear transport factor 2 family protein [Acidimicrobiales bacterium]
MNREEVAEARRQVRGIISAYFNALDTGDMRALGEVFRYGRTRAQSSRSGAQVIAEPDEPYEGSERIIQQFVTHNYFYDGTPSTKHFTTNLTMEIHHETNRATSRSRFTVVQARPGFPLQPIVTGRYVDSFEWRAGRWWLVDRFEDCFLWGDVRHHLVDELRRRLQLPEFERRAPRAEIPDVPDHS